MSRLNKLFLVATISALFCFAVQAVNAQTIIVGPNNDLSRYPIGLDPASATSAFPDFGAGDSPTGLCRWRFLRSDNDNEDCFRFKFKFDLWSRHRDLQFQHWTEHYICRPKQSEHKLCGKQRQ